MENEKMPEEGATQEKPVSQLDNSEGLVDKPCAPRIPQFLPRLLKKKVTVRPIQGQPITGTLDGFNNYEIQILVGGKKQILVFKHAILSIEMVG